MNGILQHLGEEKYAELLMRSAVIGEDKRLFEALSRDKISIAFLGGSVTYGYMSEVNFPTLLFEKLRERYPEKAFSCTNLGLSGTAGLMGLVLTEDILRGSAPDIVMVEYAVNEEATPLGAQIFEGLIRKLLSLPSHPAVVPVCIFNKMGYSCEEMMLHISKHYGLSAAALFSGVFPLFESGELPWELYSDDYCHPSPNGHRLIADVIMKVFEGAKGEKTVDYPPAIISDSFAPLRLIDLKYCAEAETDMPFFDGDCFILHGGRENVADCSHRLSLRIFCKKLVVITLQSNDPAFGDLTVRLDGNGAAKIQGYSIFAWGNPLTTLILNSETAAEHLLELFPDSESLEKRFVILRIAAA